VSASRPSPTAPPCRRGSFCQCPARGLRRRCRCGGHDGRAGDRDPRQRPRGWVGTEPRLRRAAAWHRIQRSRAVMRVPSRSRAAPARNSTRAASTRVGTLAGDCRVGPSEVQPQRSGEQRHGEDDVELASRGRRAPAGRATTARRPARPPTGARPTSSRRPAAMRPRARGVPATTGNAAMRDEQRQREPHQIPTDARVMRLSAPTGPVRAARLGAHRAPSPRRRPRALTGRPACRKTHPSVARYAPGTPARGPRRSPGPAGCGPPRRPARAGPAAPVSSAAFTHQKRGNVDRKVRPGCRGTRTAPAAGSSEDGDVGRDDRRHQ
jgi:hypothetical protein